GAYSTSLAFCAQQKLLRRMTCNMKELPVAEDEDVEEYTKEFCNVLCGRLLSEVYRTNGSRARFYPPRYTTERCPANLQTGEPIHHFYYLSEQGEAAEFSWTLTPLWLERRDTKMKTKLMIVDDSPVIHAQMKKMLEDADIEIVRDCKDGETALEAYAEALPDLVTMDIILPGIDGLEAAKLLRERWGDARILMVSSLAYDDTMDQARELGAKGFLFKPFTREDLLDGIRRALAAE
ncbi:MAG: response regulator, partial [Oscillospiraceae bacterium]